MKILSVTMVIVAAMLASAFGQEKTGEKKWTIDPETGDTIYVESVIISGIRRYHTTQRHGS